MATANLRVLAPCEVEKVDFGYFADVLALWASQYVGEIALPIATHARELFGVQAVRILLAEWHGCYRDVRSHQRDTFKRVANGDECEPRDLESCRKDELAAYNTALWALIVM